MDIQESPGEMPTITFTRHEAISYLASALHNFTVEKAAQIAEQYGIELATVLAMSAAMKDAAALRALGVDPTELELAEIVHAH